MDITVTAIIILAFALVVIIGIAVAATSVINTMRRLFGTANLVKLADIRDTEMEETPKSISGMESIERPRIQEDFPQMSIDELKSKNKDEIFAFYNALETEDLSRYENNKQINDKMQKLAKEYKRNNVSINKIKIHKHAISKYTNAQSGATIYFQAAVEYVKKDKNEPQGKKTQLRVNTAWVYLPENSNYNKENTFTANCPNCGAPVKSAKNTKCRYCGSNVEINFTKAWVLSNIEEI